MTFRACFPVPILVAAGCGGASLKQLKARASFDMQCPQHQIQMAEIDDRSVGVSGCGQRAVYVETCSMMDAYGGKHDCTWVLNASAKRARE